MSGPLALRSCPLHIIMPLCTWFHRFAQDDDCVSTWSYAHKHMIMLTCSFPHGFIILHMIMVISTLFSQFAHDHVHANGVSTWSCHLAHAHAHLHICQARLHIGHAHLHIIMPLCTRFHRFAHDDDCVSTWSYAHKHMIMLL